MAKAAKKTQTVAAPASVNIMVMVSNVWIDGIKFFMHDVLPVKPDVAEFLSERKQGKVTKDDATVYIDRNEAKPFRVAL